MAVRQRLFRVHIQIWLYICTAISLIVSLLAIAVGIRLTLYQEWHEKLPLYRQHLAYLRRGSPPEYWLLYKISCIGWTLTHFIHCCTLILTAIGSYKTRPRLLIPQFVILIIMTGFYICCLSSLFILSVTRVRHLFFSIAFISFFAFFAGFNLFVLVLFHRFLRDKADALSEYLSNTKTVHFKKTKY